MKEREFWTFEPTKENRSLVGKAVNAARRELKAKGIKQGRRGAPGLRNQVLNEYLRQALWARFAGKREGAQ